MSKTGHLFEHLLTHYRGLFATLVLLPASALYSAYIGTRNLIVFRLKSVPDRTNMMKVAVLKSEFIDFLKLVWDRYINPKGDESRIDWIEFPPERRIEYQ